MFTFGLGLLVGLVLGAFFMMRYADKHYCNGIWDKEKELRLIELETRISKLRTSIANHDLETEKVVTRRIKELGEFE